jgi:DNA-binding response OmpR family regulator
MVIRFGALTIDKDRYEVAVGGRPVQLTYQEFRALWHIASLEGRVATYDELSLELWGEVEPRAGRRLAVLMSRLRAKLGEDGAGLVNTVTRVGYRLSEQTSER